MFASKIKALCDMNPKVWLLAGVREGHVRGRRVLYKNSADRANHEDGRERRGVPAHAEDGRRVCEAADTVRREERERERERGERWNR